MPDPDAEDGPVPDPGPEPDASIAERIEDLADRAAADRAAFDPPADPPDEERAMAYLREGFGRAVWLYVEARTGEWERLAPAEMARLEDAMNTWLELYARCYGRRIDAAFVPRKAAELLLETHNVKDTAQLLTHVPPRHGTDR